MQRRSFIKLSLATTVALTHQACDTSPFKGNKAFYYPQVMMKCTDEENLGKIGTAYRCKVPSEQTEDQLLAALYRDAPGDLALLTNSQDISNRLSTRIKSDFNEQKTIVLEGWVLSVTEARQCALFSLRQ